MEQTEKIHKIKQDLRQLRKITHSIKVSTEVKERHERRIALLMQEKTENMTRAEREEHDREIEKIRAVLSSLHIEESIKHATDIELRYMAAIDKLDRLDKTIILDGYINGKAYWKIGRDIGYTEVGIQKRVKRIIETLANYL